MEEEYQRRLSAMIEERVQEIMNSDSVQQSLTARLVDERKVLEAQVPLYTLERLPCRLEQIIPPPPLYTIRVCTSTTLPLA